VGFGYKHNPNFPRIEIAAILSSNANLSYERIIMFRRANYREGWRIETLLVASARTRALLRMTYLIGGLLNGRQVIATAAELNGD
jgi:hypothetical protein